MQTLLIFGANPNHAVGSGRTPIHVAAGDGRIGALRTLIEAGLDCGMAIVKPNSPYNGRTPLDIVTQHQHQPCIDLLTTTISKCTDLQNAARDGDEEEVWRLIRNEHANIVHAGVNACDIARDAGHGRLAAEMRELWTSVSRSYGYKRYNTLQADRSRWVILRQRLLTSPASQQGFAQATLSPRDRTLLDWLIVGTNHICPIDVLSVVMAYWS